MSEREWPLARILQLLVCAGVAVFFTAALADPGIQPHGAAEGFCFWAGGPVGAVHARRGSLRDMVRTGRQSSFRGTPGQGTAARDATGRMDAVVIDPEDGARAVRSCQDCGAAPGQKHDDGCDTARCLHTGHQRLSCPGDHDCGEDTWTGEWPGTAECREYGLWARQPPSGPLMRCGENDPGAVPDVTRLMLNGVWDREARRWVLLDGAPL